MQRKLPIEIVPASEVITMNDIRAGLPAEEGQLGPRGGAPGARGEGRRDGQRGKYGRGDDRGKVFARNAGVGWNRVALAAPFPNAKGGVPCCSTSAQRGFETRAPGPVRVMGEVYYRATIWQQTPPRRIALRGEEEIKGNELTREVYTRLKQEPGAFWSATSKAGICFPATWMSS